MPSSRLAIWTLIALLAGCAGEADSPEQPRPEPASSELLVSALDRETGAPPGDPELTLRYLVRTPITLDATAVERVPSSVPYRIVHAVSTDSLVVELRIESASYATVDTVLAVERGASAPFELALRRLDGAAPARPQRVAATPERSPPESPAPAGSGSDDPRDLTADRSGLRDGDAAFERQDWRAAVAAYRRMVPPRGRGPYAREYLLGLVRLGISQINLGQWPGAYDALAEARTLDAREYTIYFYLGQVECALGRFDEGRRTLGEVERLASTISPAQRPIVLVTVDYQRAVCSHEEFQRARTEAAAQAAAARALGELDEFVERGEALDPVPPPVRQAIADARRRIQEIAGR